MEEIEYLEEYEDFILPPNDNKSTGRLSVNRASLDSLDGLYKDLISDPSMSVPELSSISQFVARPVTSSDRSFQLTTQSVGLLSKSLPTTKTSTNTARSDYMKTKTKLESQQPLYKSSTYMHRATNKSFPTSSAVQKSNKLKSVATVKSTLQKANNPPKQIIRNDTPPIKSTTMGRSYHTSPLVSSTAQTVTANISKSNVQTKNAIVCQFEGLGVDPLSLEENDAFLDFDVDKHQLMTDFDFDSDLDNSFIGRISDLDSVDLSDEFSEGNFNLDSDMSSRSSDNITKLPLKRKKSEESTLEHNSKIPKNKPGSICTQPENEKDQLNPDQSRRPQPGKNVLNQQNTSQKFMEAEKKTQQPMLGNKKDLASVKSQLVNKKEITIKSFTPRSNNLSSNDQMPKLTPQQIIEEPVTPAVSGRNLTAVLSQSNAVSNITIPESSISARKENDKVYVNKKRLSNNDETAKSNESIADNQKKSPPTSLNPNNLSPKDAAPKGNLNVRMKFGSTYLKSIKPPGCQDLNSKKMPEKEATVSASLPQKQMNSTIKRIPQKDVNTSLQQQSYSTVNKTPQKEIMISTADPGVPNNQIENIETEEKHISRKAVQQTNAGAPCPESKLESKEDSSSSSKYRNDQPKNLNEKNKKQSSKAQADDAGNQLSDSIGNQNCKNESGRVVFSTAASPQKPFLKFKNQFCKNYQTIKQKQSTIDNKKIPISPHKFKICPFKVRLSKTLVAKFIQSREMLVKPATPIVGKQNSIENKIKQTRKTDSVALMANEPSPGNGLGRMIKSLKDFYSKLEESRKEPKIPLGISSLAIKSMDAPKEKTHSQLRKRKKKRKTKKGTRIQRTNTKPSNYTIDSTTVNYASVAEEEIDVPLAPISTAVMTSEDLTVSPIIAGIEVEEHEKCPLKSGVLTRDQVKTKPAQITISSNIANTTVEKVTRRRSPVKKTVSSNAANTSVVQENRRLSRPITRNKLKEKIALVNSSKRSSQLNKSSPPAPVSSTVGISQKQKTVEPLQMLLTDEVLRNEDIVGASISDRPAEPSTIPKILINPPKDEFVGDSVIMCCDGPNHGTDSKLDTCQNNKSSNNNSGTKITVFELPSFIVMKTKIITRRDLSSGKAYVPPLVKQKFDKLAERHVIPMKTERPAFEDVCREINALLDQNANYLKFASGSERQTRMNQVLADSSLSVEDAQCALKFLQSYLVSQRPKVTEDTKGRSKGQQFIPIYDSQKKIIGYRKRTRHSKRSNDSVSWPQSQRILNLSTHTLGSGTNITNNGNRNLPTECETTVLQKVIHFTAKKEPQVMDGGDGEIIVPDAAPTSEQQRIKTEVDTVIS